MESAVVAGENPATTGAPGDNLGENSENLGENSENLGENSENPPPPKRGGRPPGAKDKVPRATPRRKVTIVEEPLLPPAPARVAAPPKAPPAKAKASPKAPPTPKAPAEQQVRYVDRFVEHSPRTLMHLAASHAMDAQRSKQDARREHFSNVFTSRLVELP